MLVFLADEIQSFNLNEMGFDFRATVNRYMYSLRLKASPKLAFMAIGDDLNVFRLIASMLFLALCPFELRYFHECVGVSCPFFFFFFVICLFCFYMYPMQKLCLNQLHVKNKKEKKRIVSWTPKTSNHVENHTICFNKILQIKLKCLRIHINQ